MSDFYLIFGPTASGKTALSLRLAEKIGAEIVNMDSMQVYDGISIISAAPNQDEMAGITHHLFGFIKPSHIFSTGEYVAEVAHIVEKAKTKGKPLVFVGGTGLYAHALTQGLIDIPPIAPEIRQKARDFVQNDIGVAYEYLKKIDGASALAIKPNDAQRIARAIEVFEATKKPLSEWQSMPQTAILAANKWRGFKVLPPREIVHNKIAKRFRAMMKNGGIEEVENLWKQGLSRELPALKALGIPHLLDYFDGGIDLESAIELAIIATRQYAKRQYTWANNRAKDWEIYDTARGWDF